MKYYPNCLKECSVSPYGGFAYNDCGVLQYSNAILFDTPDLEKQKDYKLKELLKSIVHYDINDDKINSLILEIKELLAPPYH